MKKQELIHLHGLLAEVSTQYETWTGNDLALEEYRALDTRRTSIHKSKGDHKEAVLALAGDLVTEMDEEETKVTLSAD